MSIYIWSNGGKWYFGPDKSRQSERWPYDTIQDCLEAFRIWRNSSIAQLMHDPIIEIDVPGYKIVKE